MRMDNSFDYSTEISSVKLYTTCIFSLHIMRLALSHRQEDLIAYAHKFSLLLTHTDRMIFAV